MNKIRYFLYMVTALLLSCETVSDEEIILYDGESRVYFNIIKNDAPIDSIAINLASFPTSDTYSVEIPTKLMGLPDANNDRYYHIEPVEGVSNPTYLETEVGTHYEELNEDGYLLQKDSINSKININIVGKNIESNKTYEIRLKIKDANNFSYGVIEQSVARIVITFAYSKPAWWDQSGITTEFNATIMAKLIELHPAGSAIASDDYPVFNDYYGLMVAFKGVSDWLDANPDLGITFNDFDKQYVFGWV